MTAYSTRDRDRLFNLLPAWLREQDAPDRTGDDAPPGPLQALLAVIEREADAVDADITQLANDAFVETCEPWVIPYIGDLVGTTPMFDDSRVRGGDSAAEVFTDLQGPSLKPLIGLGNRADVAKTIYYRRRKGTLPMLEVDHNHGMKLHAIAHGDHGLAFDIVIGVGGRLELGRDVGRERRSLADGGPGEGKERGEETNEGEFHGGAKREERNGRAGPPDAARFRAGDNPAMRSREDIAPARANLARGSDD